MKERESPRTDSALRTLTIRDPAVAELLIDPERLRHLAPFLGRERSVSEAARESGARPNTALRRVQRLLDLGLLEVARELPRGGRPVKLYRSVAEIFFVPFDATSADTLETALAERDAYWEGLLRRHVVSARSEQLGSWGTRIYRDQRGRLQVQTALDAHRNTTSLDEGDPAILSAWRDRVYLDYPDAKALQRELFELLLRYQRKGGSQRYVVRAGMAPVNEDR
jgi:hypothetical protein